MTTGVIATAHTRKASGPKRPAPAAIAPGNKKAPLPTTLLMMAAVSPTGPITRTRPESRFDGVMPGVVAVLKSGSVIAATPPPACASRLYGCTLTHRLSDQELRDSGQYKLSVARAATPQCNRDARR